MKRKLLTFLLLTSLLVLTVLALTSCDILAGSLPEEDPDLTEAEYRAVYDAYATFMAETQKTPLTYEAWLLSVKGEKGEKGDKGEKGEDGLTPFIGTNGNWWIGLTDTGITAEGAKGDKGDIGERGDTGRGIQRMEIIGGSLVVFYTDGTYENLGKITDPDTPPATTAAPLTTAPPTTTAPSGGTVSDKWENVKFTGETLKIEYNTYTQATLETAGASNSNKFITGPDTYTSNAVDKALWERNKKVIDRLGITIEYTTDDTSSVVELLPHYRGLIEADAAPHIFVTQNYGLIRAEIVGYLHNLKDGYGTASNYFAFEGEDSVGWYMDIMNSTTLSKDQLYVASGDFLLDSLRMSYSTFVNVSMFDELFSMEDGMDYLYELILNPSKTETQFAWSYDTMKEFAARATEINNQDETLSRYGLLANSFASRAFFFSSGLDIFSYDAQGTPTYVTDILPLHDYTDSLISLLGPRSEYLPKLGSADAGNVKCLERFQNGLGLFMTDQFLCTLEGARLQDMDDLVAVIPYPKYDLTEDYHTLVSDSANSGGICVNSSAAEFTMASAYIQMMTEYSNDVIYQYFDVGLKLKNNKANNPKQIEVLDIIRDSLTLPTAYLFDNFVSREITDNGNPHSGGSTAATIYDLLQHSVEKDTNFLSSGWDRNIAQKRNQLASLVAEFER